MTRWLPVVTCEHGGNRVPRGYRPLFAGADELLASHRGYDVGALGLARSIAAAVGVPLLAHTVSRMVVDLNRSLSHPRAFSPFTRSLDEAARRRLVDSVYAPHRARVERAIAAAARRGPVVHLAVHTFVPVLDGRERNADVGLLYDPARTAERSFCRSLQHRLARDAPALRVRRNYPYRGRDDGLTTALRGRWRDAEYLGIELELNQRWVSDAAAFRRVRRLLAAALCSHIA